jgi:glycine/D-amino acid oxidase-like deaminating enzyme
MLSYWEKKEFLRYDYIVIGAGIVGLSTAISLRDHSPAASILVLERGLMPTGASTKNAGFACIGSLTEILDDLSTMSPAMVLELTELRLRGLHRLRRRVGDSRLGYAQRGSYELINEREFSALDHFYEINELLRPLLDRDAFSHADHLIGEFKFDKKHVKHLISNDLEGELDTGLMMKALLALCMEKGIEIKTGAEVVGVVQEGTDAKVLIEQRQLGQNISLTAARAVAICTNAFTERIIPDLDIKPGRGQVLITQPIPGLCIKGIFHFDRGFYYFREVDGRILFGGGRNLDFATERTSTLAYNELIIADLVDKLGEIILPDTPFEIDYVWAGIMAFGDDKFPIIRQHSQNVYMGVRMGGMGVAMGSEVGERLAVMMISR